MPTKKVIFCTQSFPGTGGGGTFNLIKYLPRHGYEPIVITNNHRILEMEHRLLQQHFPNGLRIYRTACLPKSPFRVFAKFCGLPRFAGFLDKFFFVPDIYVTGVLAAAIKAVSLIRTEAVECVITSSPPESFHLIGLLVQRLTGCSWVAHCRDLWTTKAIVHQPPTPFHSAVLRKLERAIYARADHLVANTRGNREVYLNRFGIPDERITIITNGYDATELRAPAPNQTLGLSDVFRLGYMGYFDKPGFPWQSFLVALKKVAIAVGEEKLEFHIAGHVSPTAKDFIANNGLSKVVRLHGVLAHAAAFSLVLQTDLAVVLHYETGYSKAIVPHKLYHYLGMRKPIFAVGEADGEMAVIIREADAGRVVSVKREDGIFNELLRFYQAWKTDSRISYQGKQDQIHRYEVQQLTAKLAATITQTVQRRWLHSGVPLRRPLCPTD